MILASSGAHNVRQLAIFLLQLKYDANIMSCHDTDVPSSNDKTIFYATSGWDISCASVETNTIGVMILLVNQINVLFVHTL